MEANKGSGRKKPEGFFDGKGFYIVLFLCAAVIGVSAWTLLSGTGTMEDPAGDISVSAPRAVQTPAMAEPPAENGEEVVWEIPEGVEEVLAEAPQIASETVSVPEPYEAPSRTFIWPVVGEIEQPYAVTSLLYSKTMGDWRTHSGVDVAAPLGQTVMAACSGSVVEVYDDDMYGTTVVMDHGEGLRSIYSGLAALPTVKAGDAVLCGETIGAVGDTALCESSEPTHLHFAMTLSGESVDPGEYLPKL